jgi:AhpD family alkylhydroperoxidase
VRLNPYAARPDVYQAVLSVSRELARGELADSLRCLVELRVSQVNRCGFCLAMHADGARAAGVSQAKLDTLAGWREDGTFTVRERAALGVAEAVTTLADAGVSEEVWDAARAVFCDEELADLLYLIGLINLYNRVNIAAAFPAERWRSRGVARPAGM